MRTKIILAVISILIFTFFAIVITKNADKVTNELPLSSEEVKETEIKSSDDAIPEETPDSYTEQNDEVRDVVEEEIVEDNVTDDLDTDDVVDNEKIENNEDDTDKVHEYVSVEGISLSFYSTSLVVGDKVMPIVSVNPRNATNKGEIWSSSDTAVATVDSIGNIVAVSVGECVVTVKSEDNPDIYATVGVKVSAGIECTYIDGILIANKTYPLPKTYAPGWETEATPHLWDMINDAAKDGIKLWMTSGYRSWYDQQYIYNGYVAEDGKEAADRYSARPGHSEHQTGLAYDLNDLSHDFGDTPEGIWVAENCHKYGFIVRYPKDKEDITGYIYEPWHVRYIGVEKATLVYESGLCLEEFLGITSVYSY